MMCMQWGSCRVQENLSYPLDLELEVSIPAVGAGI